MKTVFRTSLIGATIAISLAACGAEKPAPSAALRSIAVSPANPSIAPGTTIKLSAIGTYTNNGTANLGTQVTWSSSDPGVASVSNAAGSHGLVTAGASTGRAVISAVYTGISGSTGVTTSPLAVLTVAAANQTSIAPGTSRQFTASGTLENNATQDLTIWATWTASDPSLAAVSNAVGAQGLATALIPGSSIVKATYSGVTGTAPLVSSHVASITTSPATVSIGKGTAQLFSAAGVLADGSLQDLTTWATWSSTDPSVASFNNTSGQRGLLSAINMGTTLVTASLDSIASSPPSTCTVTAAVLSSIDVTPASSSIPLGKTQQFTARGTYSDASTKDVTASATWHSSKTGVAGISNTAGSAGLATSVAEGSTTITASLSGITSAEAVMMVKAPELVSILVTPLTAQIIITQTMTPSKQYTAVGAYTDGTLLDLTASATWSSSNTGAAAISNASGSEGLATANVLMPANEVRSTNITAVQAGITSNSAALTVSQFLP